MDSNQKNKIILPCAPGLSGPVGRELTGLGFPVLRTDPKAVETEGTFSDAMMLNYKMRTANRVLWFLTGFRAIHPNHLYKNAIKLPWEQLLEPEGYFSIDSFVKNQFIRDSRFANLKLKDAIADRFSEQTGRRPDSGSEKDHAVVYMRWMEEDVELFIDLSGHTIAKHGYRRIPGSAPLMENLAAAMINETKWDRNSHFVNPMCGSGTLAIEAALMALDIYPGRFRTTYGFQHIQLYDQAEWYKIRDQIESARTSNTLNFKIIATDIDRRAVSNGRENAKAAGVDHLIDFKVCSFENTEVPDGGGVVMFNPEYGERMGEIEELEKTHEEIGNFLKKKCVGYTGYIFTGNLELAKKVGLRTKRKIPFFNGPIECRLLEYEMY